MTGAEFKKWRVALGLTQQDVGDLLDRTRASINAWENSAEKDVPQYVEIACAELRRRIRMRGEHGPVVLYWHDQPAIQPTDRPAKVAQLQMERHGSVDAAVDRACFLINSRSRRHYGYLIHDADGMTLWHYPDLLREARVRSHSRRRPARATRER